jgi:hypothetical protein
MRGSAQHAEPLAILRLVPLFRLRPFALRAPYPASNGRKPILGYRGIVLSRLLSCSHATIALATVAIVVAGCAGANNNTTASQGEQQPYKTMYGITSEGTTTDLYTEFFGPRKPAAAPETATATAQPVTAPTASQQGATAPIPPAQAATTSAAKGQTKPAAAGTSRQVQPAPVPAPAPVAVAQQPPAPQAQPEPDVPTAYGITANGPTTDLFTELFGPRRRDGQ